MCLYNLHPVASPGRGEGWKLVQIPKWRLKVMEELDPLRHLPDIIWRWKERPIEIKEDLEIGFMGHSTSIQLNAGDWIEDPFCTILKVEAKNRNRINSEYESGFHIFTDYTQALQTCINLGHLIVSRDEKKILKFSPTKLAKVEYDYCTSRGLQFSYNTSDRDSLLASIAVARRLRVIPEFHLTK